MDRNEWRKEIKKALIDRGEQQKDMAEALGLNYGTMRQVLTGAGTSRPMENAISEYLKVPMYEE